jgi:uncharacterized protein YndB with AHSA1/START domain
VSRATSAKLHLISGTRHLFMTVVLTFEDQGGKTKYTARVHHWSVADREAHERMGFHPGWATCAEQLCRVLPGVNP